MAARVFVNATPSDSSDEDVEVVPTGKSKTSTPFLSGRKRRTFELANFDVSSIDPEPRSSDVLNETVAKSRIGRNLQKNTVPKPYRRIVAIESSSEEEEEKSVDTILATPSTSSEKLDFLTACESNVEQTSKLAENVKKRTAPPAQPPAAQNSQTSKHQRSQNAFQSSISVVECSSDNTFESSSVTSPLSAPPTPSEEDTLPVTGLAEQMGNVSLVEKKKSTSPTNRNVETFNVEDLTDLLEDVIIEETDQRDPRPGRAESSSPEILEICRRDEIQTHPTSSGVRVPPPAPKPERKLGPRGPAPRKAIFLDELPLHPVTKPSLLPDQLRGGVGELITKLQKIIINIPKDDGQNLDLEVPGGLKVDLYPHQKYALKWLWWREHKKPYGGILADEMGLGKTVMILALICRGKSEGPSENTRPRDWQSSESFRLVPSRSTLVVCPPSVIGQWEDEINKKSRGLRVLMYHGQSRTKSSAVLAQYDVVITTYQTLGAEIPKLSEQTTEACRSPVIRVHWERIVLDEGHSIRNPKTGLSQAACRITAQRRWVVTGTPVHNKAEDMFALVKFLRLAPFDDPKVWESWIGMKSINREGAQRLNTLAKSLVLRRTKDQVLMGQSDSSMASIPPKTIKDIYVDLPEAEKDIYDHLDAFATKEFRAFLKNKDARSEELQRAANQYIAGRRPVKSSEEKTFSHIFTLILRLRQCAVAPWLIRSMIDDEDVDEDSSEFDPVENMVSLKNPVFSDEYKSVKLTQLYQDIDDLRRQCKAKGERMEKVVIVSQWTSLLKVVDSHLKMKGYSTTTISGEVKIADRTDIVMRFNLPDKRPSIMLLSLTAGGVGLNLIGANHLFFLDIHWNPQLELQAQDRIHRFGQKKPVTIYRYISRGTIEERVVDLQKNKLQLAEGVLTTAQQKAGSGLSIGEMRTLFGV